MALSVLQDLIRRVSLLEDRRGADMAMAQVLDVDSDVPAGSRDYYGRWKYDVQIVDRDFLLTGTILRGVTALRSQLTADGTLTGQTALGGVDPHTHTPGDLAVVSPLVAVGDIVVMANVRLGRDSLWVILGKLEPALLTEINTYRAGL